VVGATLRSLRRVGPAGLAAAGLTALAILITGATLAGTMAVERTVRGWRDALRIIAVLRTPVGTPEGLVTAVRALPGVAGVRYVSADAALAELRRLLGPRGEDLDRLPANPVPARLEITPGPELDAGALRALVRALDRQPGVEEVQAVLDWVEPSERVLRGLRRGGLALGAALALAALAAMGGAIRGVRRARIDEDAILRLAGVSGLRLALPWVLTGVGLASAGALVGLGGLLLGSAPGAPWTAGWLGLALGLEPLPLLPPAWLVALGAGGMALGLAAALATARPRSGQVG
jgi:cell division protein FtsX